MRYNPNIILDRLCELSDEYKHSKPDNLKGLADKLDISYTTLLNIRRCEFVPSTRIIYAFCKAFNVSADWLLGLSDKKERDSK